VNRYGETVRAAWRVWRAYKSDPLWVKVLSDEAQQLGSIYVKFLQQLASTEILSALFARAGERLSIYDDVALEQISVQETLSRELGERANNIIAEAEPFASGSFAQVYRCKIADEPSTQFVVKILRPSIKQNLRIDCRLLLVGTWMFQRAVRSDLFDMYALAKEFVEATTKETDYEYERDVATYIYEYFAKRTANVVIPRMIKQYSTKQVLVQEYIDGLPLTSALNVAQEGGDSFRFVYERTGSDMRIQLGLVGSELLSAVLHAEWIMADPHPGNIYLLANNKIAMIDFGLVAPAPAHRSAFFGMISQYRALYEDRADMGVLAIAMMAFYDYELYQALNVVTSHGSLTSSLQQYISRTAEVTGVLNGKLASQRRITQLFLTELNAGNRFAIRIDPRDAILQKAMHSFLATTRLACGEMYRKSYYWGIVHDALATAEDEARHTGIQEAGMLTGTQLTLEDAQEIVMDWLTKVAERDRSAYGVLLQQGGIAV
jgi:ubiquinone biosynthesis protein